MSLELEKWVVCIKQLEDVLALQTLLCLPPPQGSTGGAASRCSVKSLSESGRGRQDAHTVLLSVKLGLDMSIFTINVSRRRCSRLCVEVDLQAGCVSRILEGYSTAEGGESIYRTAVTTRRGWETGG